MPSGFPIGEGFRLDCKPVQQRQCCCVHQRPPQGLSADCRRARCPCGECPRTAAQESQYGSGRIARELNNYFSLHAPAPFQIGAEAPLGNARIKVAKFSSFLQSAQSFAARYGHAVKGRKEPLAFSQALVSIGFNTGNATNGGRDGFAHYLADIIKVVRGRMACPPE
jgi:hypothetical protein